MRMYEIDVGNKREKVKEMVIDDYKVKKGKKILMKIIMMRKLEK